MSQQTPRFYEFGDFRLDLEEKVLLRGENFVSVTPKVYETLLALVEEAGRVVGKDELMRKIWSDRFVEESNLTFNIKMLRRALGDDAANPRFIETVPRRGYRFIAGIKKISLVEKQNNSSPAKASAIRTLQPHGKLLLPVAAALGLILLGTIMAGSWLTRNRTFADTSNAPILSAPFSSEKLSSSGNLRHAVVSPDGRLFAYVNESGGKYSVWLRRLESSDNVQIVPLGANHYHGLVFAHDGQTLYFVRKPTDDDTVAAVYRISVFGGVAERIAERVEGWISLSPDDKQLSFVRCEKSDEDYCSLFVAETNGRNERKIVTRKRPFHIADNQFSPDGKSIAFAAGQALNGGSDYRLMRVELSNGEQSEISPRTFFIIKSLKWLPDGDGLFLTAKESLDGKLNIWLVSSATGEAQTLTKDATDYLTISLNKDADKLIATQSLNNFQLHFSENRTTTILTSARDLSFTPDGKIIYSTFDGDIWTINRDGSTQRQLTNSAFIDFSPVVSPDNQSIYFASNRTGANQVWRMNADGSNQTQLTIGEGGYPRFVSPDGKWVYYESGFHQTLWKVSAEGDGELQVSKTKMYEPAISPDGRLAAYFFRDEKVKIGVMNLADQTLVKTIDYGDGKSRATKIAWSADNRMLNFIADEGGKNVLWQQSLDESAPRMIADLGGGQIEEIALAPDGNGLAYIRGEWLSDAVLIKGFK